MKKDNGSNGMKKQRRTVKKNLGRFSLTTDRGSIPDSIVAYIDQRYMTSLTLDHLAGMAGVSRFTFSRQFKKKFGRTFISYLNTIRVAKAVDLLKNPEHRIGEIARQAGYRSAEHFARVFRGVYRVSPREFRKKLMEVHEKDGMNQSVFLER